MIDSKVVKSFYKAPTQRKSHISHQNSWKRGNLNIDIKQTEKSLSENQVYYQVKEYNLLKEFLSIFFYLIFSYLATTSTVEKVRNKSEDRSMSNRQNISTSNNITRENTMDKLEKPKEVKTDRPKEVVSTNQSIQLEKNVIYQIKEGNVYKTKDLIFDDEETKDKCVFTCCNNKGSREGSCIIF